MRKRFLFLLAFLIAAVPFAGWAGQPKSFVKGETTQWRVYDLRSDVDFDHAWEAVLDLLVNDFDLAMALKEDGYMRTEWLYSYGGKYNAEYRVRVSIRFAPDRRTVRVKTDAELKDGDNWIIGFDTRLLATLKTDIMGTVGRTTR